MQSPDLYDRVNEFEQLRTLLGDLSVRSVVVNGVSGVGNSILVEKSLNALGLSDATIVFSFKTTSIGSGPPLVSFLLDLYRQVRPGLLNRFTNLEAKDIAVGTNYVRVSFSILKESLDGNFFEYFFERLWRRGTQILRIENVELCEYPDDIKLLSVLIAIREPRVKLLFEIGSLQEISGPLKSSFAQTIESRRTIAIGLRSNEPTCSERWPRSKRTGAHQPVGLATI
jgi:hypothetical protein